MPKQVIDRKAKKRKELDGLSENTNRQIISYNSDSITTIEDLLKKLGLSKKCLDDDAKTEWYVEDYLVNKWESAARNRETDEWDVQPLFQVKAWFIRRKPKAIEFPEIQPIRFDQPTIVEKKTKKKEKKIRTALIVPDAQIGFFRDLKTGKLDPFHDRKALDIALTVAKETQPDRIIFLGDMLDLPDWTDKFFRSPEMYFTTQPALVEAGWWMSQFRQSCPTAEIDWLEGNHELRLTKAIGTNLLAAWDVKRDSPHPVMSIPYLVGLDEMNIGYHGPWPDSAIWLNDNLRVSHGSTVRAGSGDTVKAILNSTGCSEIVGHIHRCEIASKTSWRHRGPVVYVACSPGTMARIDGPVPKYDARVNWQQGLALVEYESGNGGFQIQLAHIYDGECILKGKKLYGTDRAKAMSSDTNYSFV